MRYFKVSASLAIMATLSIPMSATAQATKPCISKEQVSIAVSALLPPLIETMSSGCKDFLPQNASLSRLDVGAFQQYKAAGESATPAAGEFLVKVMGDQLPEGMKGDAILPFVKGIITSKVASDLNAETCSIANNLWAALSPLPPENWGQIVAGIMAATKPKNVSAKKGSQNAMPAICPYIAEIAPLTQ
jgi:hypothetical protein